MGMVMEVKILEQAINEWETDPDIRARFSDALHYAAFLQCRATGGVQRYRVKTTFVGKVRDIKTTFNPGAWVMLSADEAAERIERGEIEMIFSKGLRA